MRGKNLFRIIPILLLFASPAFADNITYEFTLLNAPSVGSFSWEVTVPSAITTLSSSPDLNPFIFSTFNADSAPANGGGCQISSVQLIPEGFGGLGIDTFFSPLCQGGFDSTSAGLSVTQANGLGIYSFSGAGQDGKSYTDILVITDSNLPITPNTADPPGVPEPSMLVFLAAAVTALLFARRLTVRKVQAS